jgi:hypothetical protein
MNVHRQATNRLGDRREPIGEVRAAPTPDLRALVQLADKDAEAVMLDFVQPTGSGGGTVDERGFARADEPTGGNRRQRAGEARQTFLNPPSRGAWRRWRRRRLG